MKDNKECDACKMLKKGLTWIGTPPKCVKHRTNIRFDRYYEG